MIFILIPTFEQPVAQRQSEIHIGDFISAIKAICLPQSH